MRLQRTYVQSLCIFSLYVPNMQLAMHDVEQYVLQELMRMVRCNMNIDSTFLLTYRAVPCWSEASEHCGRGVSGSILASSQ
jgi:hypothetical protein